MELFVGGSTSGCGLFVGRAVGGAWLFWPRLFSVIRGLPKE